MAEYTKVFKKILQEYDLPDTSRNQEDANFDDETDPSEFEVDPMSHNVGFSDLNTERDTETLMEIRDEINGISEKLSNTGERLASLNRSFPGILELTKDVAAAFEKVGALETKLGGFVVGLPAQKQKQEKETQENNSEF